MIRWKRSKLKRGERLKIQESMLVTRDGKRFIKAVYDGETKYGIRLRLFFEPGPMTEDTTWNYKVFVDLASIYCGDVKLQTANGETINAVRLYN